MTKRELVELELLKLEVELHKSFHMTEGLKPDVPPPTEPNTLTRGWTYNEHSMRVLTACSSIVSHGLDSTTTTTSQRPIHLYSTQEKAYRALRSVLERKYAHHLMIIDKRIKQLNQGE